MQHTHDDSMMMMISSSSSPTTMMMLSTTTTTMLGSALYKVVLISSLVLLLLVQTTTNAAAAAASASSSSNTNTKQRTTTTATKVVNTSGSGSGSGDKSMDALRNLDNYRSLPLRTRDEAAVLEWGHSAIISALDASVAHFGPQTSEAALLEVEATPILANPINGMWSPSPPSPTDRKKKEDDNNDNSVIRPLKNADEINGNVAVMTKNNNNDDDELSGVEMALIAQTSGAAALLVVNLDEEHPEDIYRLSAAEDDDDEQRSASEEIQIPVAMISLNSANALTSATVEPGTTEQSDIVNNGMPDRVRLYAGGDRPFFEDVKPVNPTVYLIHNLLTETECDKLVEQAKDLVQPVTKNDVLQLTTDHTKFRNVERVMLWQGQLQSPSTKQIEERIEQVTGFPANHFSDWVVDKLDKGSHWLPHVDTISNGRIGSTPLATITVFLTEDSTGNSGGGGEMVFPSTTTDPIKIQPVKGLAVVHHNTEENDQNELDVSSVHALLPANTLMYVARKFIFLEPVPNAARRVALPAFALPFGGRLPAIIVSAHDILVEKLGQSTGETFFDKACVFIPALIVLILLQRLGEYVHRQLTSGGGSSGGSAGSAGSGTSKSSKEKQQQSDKSNSDSTNTKRSKKKKN